MIKNKEMARTFFEILSGMGYEQVCFDDEGAIAHLGDCDMCECEGDCYFRSYWIEDSDSVEYFVEDYDLSV